MKVRMLSLLELKDCENHFLHTRKYLGVAQWPRRHGNVKYDSTDSLTGSQARIALLKITKVFRLIHIQSKNREKWVLSSG